MIIWRFSGMILLLLLGGLVISGALAQAQPPPPPRAPEGQPPPRAFFDREALFARLNLTAQQRTRLTNLMNETEEKLRQLLTKLHEQRTQLMQLYQQYQFDEREALRLIQNINQVQADLLRVHHENQKQLRRILDKEQFERWTQWWKEHMFFGPPKGEWGRRGRGNKPG
ncbi:MAG: Spy/CpxP family protein refolding chaperone [Armatimonadota bacterium]